MASEKAGGRMSAELSSLITLTMSSREIADLVESRHADVCRTIERLIAAGTIDGYTPTAYTHPQNGQMYHHYLIGKRDSYVVVAQLSPQFTARLVDRWQELEEQMSIPRNLPEALRLAADLAEQKTALEQRVQRDAPKVAFVDHFVDINGSKGLREAAKILRMPERAMIEALIRDHVLYRLSGNLVPYAPRQTEGLFTVKTGAAETGHAFTQTRVTPKGLQWIAQRYASELMVG